MGKTGYIRAGWLIDGSGGPIRKNMLLTVVNGRFSAIEAYRKDKAPDSARITDLSSCTIVPPFVDCHVHLACSPSLDKAAGQLPSAVPGYAESKALIARHIKDHLSHGVFAVRDGGDHYGHVLFYKKMQEANRSLPIILKTSGRGWHQEGDYGELIGRSPGRRETLSTAFAKENDLIDQAKLVNSGPVSLRVHGLEAAPQFGLEALKKFVRLAQDKGIKVMVHANGRIPVRQAIEAGCHSIEHGFFMSRDNLKLMAEKGTVWVPTAVTMKSCLEDIQAGFRHDGDPAVVKKNLHHHLEQLFIAREYGVIVALGTNAGRSGILHGESVVEELRLLKQAGYSLPEIIRCAAYNGARLLGLEKDLGLIRSGRPAHFIAARGMYTQLPRKLSYLQAIYRNGVPA